jgi:hypothetical protein
MLCKHELYIIQDVRNVTTFYLVNISLLDLLKLSSYVHQQIVKGGDPQ